MRNWQIIAGGWTEGMEMGSGKDVQFSDLKSHEPLALGKTRLRNSNIALTQELIY
jgi:hypothetical protein